MNRLLPDFFVIGAARSGTTSVYHSLVEHPDIFMPVKKEPQFFSEHFDRGLDWYQSLFADHQGERRIGEASVSYTYPGFPTVERLQEHVPDARLVYIVRDPGDRTWSHWVYYTTYRQTERLPFEQAIENDPVYLGASDYAGWIDRYRDAFGPERLHVVVFEEFTSDPVGQMQQIYRFLDVDPSFVPASATRKTNESFKARSELLYKAYRKLSASRLRFALERFVPPGSRSTLRNAVRRVLSSDKQVPRPTAAQRAALRQRFAGQVTAVEERLGRRIDAWRGGTS